MILQLTALLIALCVIALLLFVLLVFTIRKRRKKSQDPLFGSTFKVAPPTESPVTHALYSEEKVQPSPIQVVGSENDLENFGTPVKEHGLSSRHARWSSVDKTIGSDETSEDHGKVVVCWKLWFKLEYSPITERLDVSIFKAKCFPERYNSHMNTNVFVSVYLLPEETHYQTAQYPNNGYPSFDETFVFNIPTKEFPHKRVRLSLYDIDDTRTRICLGHTAVNLFDMQELVTSRGPQYLCRDMEQLNVAGLPFCHCSRRIGTLMRSIRTGMRFYLRTNVILGTKSCKTKRTEVSTSLYGVFQCSYAFQIPPKHMDTCCLKMSVIEVDAVSGKEKVYATLVVGPCLYAHGSGVEHWKQMLSNMRKPVEMWHRLYMPGNGEGHDQDESPPSMALNMPPDIDEDYVDSSTDVEQPGASGR